MENYNEINLRQLPNSEEAEQAVLGGLMLNNHRIDDVIEIISANDFYQDRHRTIFAAITVVHSQGKPSDPLTVAELLEQKSELDRVGGFTYLNDLLDGTPSAANIRTYALIVKDHAKQRALLMLAQTISRTVYEPGDTAEKISHIESLFTKLEINTEIGERGPLEVLRSCKDIWERRANSQNGLMGFSTGFKTLDERTMGLQGPDYWVIAAESSKGKTALGINIAQNVAVDQKQPVQVFSLEMSAEQLMDRMVASVGQIPLKDIKRGKLFDPRYSQQFSAAIRKIKESKIFIDDRAGLTIDQIKSASRRFYRKHGPCLIVVDYIGLVNGKGGNKEERIADVSRQLKQIAKELNSPLIALCQTNRNSLVRNDKRPQASDIRDSAAIQHDCDILIMLYETDPNPDNVMEIIFRKHRNGEVGTDYLEKHLYVSTFKNIQGLYEPDVAQNQEAFSY